MLGETTVSLSCITLSTRPDTGDFTSIIYVSYITNGELALYCIVKYPDTLFSQNHPCKSLISNSLKS
jgi:hypothetical protein